LDFYPSIDIRAGRCVRLRQGDFDQETVYGSDPVAVALRFAADGASWVHVVDLDAARGEGRANRDVVAAIARALTRVGSEARVQYGGGVRSVDGAQELWSLGIARVVVGTAAVRDPSLVSQLACLRPEGVAVAADARAGEVATQGWEEGSGLSLAELLARYEHAGVAAVVMTAIERDGTLDGPDVAGLRAALDATALPVIASGGIGTLDDLAALARLSVGGRHLAGAIAGRALYEGRFTVAEGVAACAASA